MVSRCVRENVTGPPAQSRVSSEICQIPAQAAGKRNGSTAAAAGGAGVAARRRPGPDRRITDSVTIVVARRRAGMARLLRWVGPDGCAGNEVARQPKQ